MIRVSRSLNEVKRILAATFPDYNKRTVRLVPSEKVVFQGLNWFEGSKTEYRACSILGVPQEKDPQFDAHAPWNNPYEGKEVGLPEGCVIVEWSWFCGQRVEARIHVNPRNLVGMIEGGSNTAI